MGTAETQTTAQWLWDNAGPVIRFLLVRERLFEAPNAPTEDDLLAEMVEHPVATKWLGLFGTGPLHASGNNAVENVFGRLLEFGLRAGDAALDERVLPYVDKMVAETGAVDGLLLPFVVRAGYTHVDAVRQAMERRLASLDKGCSGSPSELFLTTEEMEQVPTAWQDRPVFRPETNPCGIESAVPWIYDLHLLAYVPDAVPGAKETVHKAVSFVMSEAFQSAPRGAVIWTPEKRVCHTCGILRLPGFFGFGGAFASTGFMQAVEAMSRIPLAARSAWMAASLEHLEGFRTDTGTYRFPAEYLLEKETYYTYGGSGMGLAENRRRRIALELESTFRMLRLKRNIAAATKQSPSLPTDQRATIA